MPELRPEFEAAVKPMPLDSLTADWVTNVRGDPGDVSELADSIRRLDLQHPIVVRPSPKSAGLFEIIEGSRRVAAYRLLAQSDPQYKKIKARVLRNCSDADAAVRSFDENDKRGNLTARELGSYIEILQRNSPHDPASKETIKWVAEKLGWFKEVEYKTKKGMKTKKLPDVTRVKRALQDAEFQKLVPNVEIKIRSRGDIKKETIPLSVAREARQAVYAARENSRLDDDQTRKQLERFLLAYAKATPPKFRRMFRERFIKDPAANIDDMLKGIDEELSKPSLEQIVGTKMPTESVNRIDEGQHSAGHEHWTRSDAVRDLIERGLEGVGL